MKHRALWLLVVAVGCGPTKPAVTLPAPPATAGEPALPAAAQGLEPAQPTLRLPRNFLPTSYTAELAIDPGAPAFTGTVAITGAVSERSSVIWLHGEEITVTKASATHGTQTVALAVTAHDPDLLEVRAAQPLDAGEWVLHFEYGGTYEPVNTTGAFKQTVKGDPYVFTQLEATYARRVFPCFDEPGNKVPWQLTLDVPTGLTAVSNMPAASDTPLGTTSHRVVFATTPPLPSYLIAFGVGPFDIIDAGTSKHGTPMRILTLKGRRADAAFAAQTATTILDTAEEWFGSPYPYPKLDYLTIPVTVGFAAMENAGLITVGESFMLIDPAKGSLRAKHGWLIDASHETAHQWFGDLVTPAYWDDIWLNESFATWLESKLAFTIDPRYHDDLAHLDDRNGALAADSLVSARQIRQPIKVPDDINNVFDGISYAKGGAVIAMFERYVGPEAFRKGVQRYLAAKAGVATSDDFIQSISAVSNPDIASSFNTFLDQPGAPELTITATCVKHVMTLDLEQHRYVPPGSPAPATSSLWSIPMCVVFDQDGKRAESCQLFKVAKGTITLPAGKQCPTWWMPNEDGAGYYRVAYSLAQAKALRDVAWPKLTVNERRAVEFDIESEAATGALPLDFSLSLIPKLLQSTDRYSIDNALGIAESLDPWVTAAQRPRYEAFLRRTFGAAAAKAGFTTKPTDSFDLEIVRQQLVGAVAWTGRDPKLVAEARQLATSWRDLPQAIRPLVLQLAVDADPALFAQTLAAVKTEPDRRYRGEMLRALAAVRDPVRQQAALALVLDPALDIRETLWLGFRASTPENEAVAREYFRAHDTAILARVPSAATTNPSAGLAGLFANTCRAESRAEVVAYIQRTFAGMAGASQVLAENIEEMDQCISQRARFEPAVQAWLAKQPAK